MAVSPTGRSTGIPVLGALPWGTHFSAFYKTSADLVGIIVPFFVAGLRANERCVWHPSDHDIERSMLEALRRQLPDVDARIASGQLRFTSAATWYKEDGRFNTDRVMEKWRVDLESALAERYAGLRASGDLGWLHAEDWAAFAEYERQLHDFLANRQALVLCTYQLDSVDPGGVFDVAEHHDFAAVFRNGAWTLLEGATLKRTKQSIHRSNERLRQLVDARTRELKRHEWYLREAMRLSHSGYWAGAGNADGNAYWSEETYRIFGLDPSRVPADSELFLSLIHPDDRARARKEIETSAANAAQFDVRFRFLRPDGRLRYLRTIGRPEYGEDGTVREYVGVILDETDRRRAARALRRARDRALHAEFAVRLVERNRVAREMHDTLLQGFTGLALQLVAATQTIRAPQEDVQRLRDVIGLAEATLAEARDAISGLRMPLPRGTLPLALRRAADEIARASGIEVELVTNGRSRPLDDEEEIAAYRIGREAVLNAVRHAAPRKVRIRLDYRRRSAVLSVSDDGRGFSLDAVREKSLTHYGLAGMQERALSVGGTLDIHSVPGKGTRVRLTIPKAPAARPLSHRAG